MARISKTEHSRILQMVDGEHRKVTEVAAEYGCTSTNIYMLLSKLRRSAQLTSKPGLSDPTLSEKPGLPLSGGPASPACRTAASAPSLHDLFATERRADQPPTATIDTHRGRTDVDIVRATVATASTEESTLLGQISSKSEMSSAASAPVREAKVTELPRRGGVKKSGAVGTTLAKPGMALMMRTAEGEENLAPFRSLDDLLSVIKPILRAAARSPDAVWFSIQPVDLASLDRDAA